MAEAAVLVGLEDVLALPPHANGRSVGALNLYSADGDAPAPRPDLLTVLTEYAGRALAEFPDSHPLPNGRADRRRHGGVKPTVSSWCR